ncbi:SRPBCC family protein [Deinococcus pimensis]|uniref:SRPBCC family protein n=1 Tax=Deinococcus pimensis TaxID=309888 RepID=UPI0004B6BCD5|nr:carbon monoxide dehydrogenase subunit G [Deinococcus pimensis]
MRLEGTHAIRAPREQVWAALNDPEVLARCVPGARDVERDGPDSYRARLELAVGPVKGVYQGKVKLTDLVPPESMTLSVEAKAPVGIVKAVGEVRLEERGEETLVHWAGTPQLAGTLATLGGRLIGGVAKQQADVFFGKLDAEVRAQRAPSTTEV